MDSAFDSKVNVDVVDNDVCYFHCIANTPVRLDEDVDTDQSHDDDNDNYDDGGQCVHDV